MFDLFVIVMFEPYPRLHTLHYQLKYLHHSKFCFFLHSQLSPLPCIFHFPSHTCSEGSPSIVISMKNIEGDLLLTSTHGMRYAGDLVHASPYLVILSPTTRTQESCPCAWQCKTTVQGCSRGSLVISDLYGSHTLLEWT